MSTFVALEARLFDALEAGPWLGFVTPHRPSPQPVFGFADSLTHTLTDGIRWTILIKHVVFMS
jgi:hypothetical protein